jgi:hypothetical protein
MSGQTQVRCTRGGREVSSRSFSLAELQTTMFGQALAEGGVTAGLDNEYESYVREQDSDSEISAHNREAATLESVLRAASRDGEVIGKTFVIDCTAEHRGAVLTGAGR